MTNNLRNNVGFRVNVLFVVLFGSLPMLARAEQPVDTNDEKGNAFFEAKIRPVLVENCYQCHSHKSGKSEGGFQLDTRDGIRAGGDSGAAIVPDKPDESLLLTAISHTDSNLKMPPKKDRLPKSVIKDFETWIKMGAPDPRVDKPADDNKPPVDLAAGKQFWAFKKPVAHPLPAVTRTDWVKRDLDRFILAKLATAGLTPSSDADSITILRRLHFDLVGLPPSPEGVRQFQETVASKGIDVALAAEADALLGSPQFGERWGRHWLDVARYGESSGKESNVSFPYAWRYRDYVIDAVNGDKPYDRFLVEQIAGDLLPYETDAQRAEYLVATGFLALGPKGLNEMVKAQFYADVADEQIDTLTRAVMACSVSCARCHDHKFDPFSMQDYYALAGIFLSTKTCYGTSVAPENQIGGDLVTLPELPGQLIFNKPMPADRVSALKSELAALQKEQRDGMAAIQKAVAKGEDPTNLFTLQDALRILWRSGGISGQLKTVDDNGKALPVAMGVLDSERISDAPLLERGEIKKPRDRVPRGFPQVIELEQSAPIDAKHSGRLQLANWMTHPDHPLTARVMANRVWHHLLGAGLVASVDNFGFTGDRPSHPELLDHLALKFVNCGWSVKSLVREIVLSRTYRQSSTWRDEAFRADPENRLLWRASKRRIDAEAIRDAMLFASGELDLKRPSGSLIAQIGDRPISIIAFDKRVPADLDGSKHRSVYLPMLRDRLPDVLELFDFADPSLVTGNRETTNVPLQALYLMNSPFVQERARGLAVRVRRETASVEEAALRAFLLCYCREPDEMEKKLARDFVAQGLKSANNSPEQILASYCQALLSTAEFRNLD